MCSRVIVEVLPALKLCGQANRLRVHLRSVGREIPQVRPAWRYAWPQWKRAYMRCGASMMSRRVRARPPTYSLEPSL